MFEAISGLIKAFFVLMQKGDFGLMAGLLFAVLTLSFSHLVIFLNYKGRLKDKDREIARLVDERNKYIDYIFDERRSSDKEEL